MITFCLFIILAVFLIIALFMATGLFVLCFGWLGAIIMDIVIAGLAIYGLVRLIQREKK